MNNKQVLTIGRTKFSREFPPDTISCSIPEIPAEKRRFVPKFVLV